MGGGSFDPQVFVLEWKVFALTWALVVSYILFVLLLGWFACAVVGITTTVHGPNKVALCLDDLRCGNHPHPCERCCSKMAPKARHAELLVPRSRTVLRFAGRQSWHEHITLLDAGGGMLGSLSRDHKVSF